MRNLRYLVIIWLVFAWPVLAQAGPKMHLPETEIDVGRVFQGEPMRGVFEVVNQGDEDLLIRRVEPG